jgi:flagellar biosynthesis protein FlhG
MKPFSDQDHYEILEVSRDATREEIERSFRMAEATYADESLAGYSVFGEGDAQAIRERIEIAYRVLSDVDARSAYDTALAGGVPHLLPSEDFFPEIELPELPELLSPAAKPRNLATPMPVDELEALEDESGEFDGGRLRRSRLHRGMELKDISRVTKISPTYLCFIEEDRYAELPAPVYVRGFVTAYAECVGLDAKRAAASYMKKFEVETGHDRRGRFLGGR